MGKHLRERQRLPRNHTQSWSPEVYVRCGSELAVQRREGPMVGWSVWTNVGSTKRCLRKVIGQSKLSYDELHTVVAEIEMVLNSRPISYISSEDLEEPLTPSHLMVGRCLCNLPDNLCYREEAEYIPVSTQSVLTCLMKYLNTAIDSFWRGRTREYLLGLRERHYHSNKTRRCYSSIPGR
jgi:hypothetical protein